MSQGETRYVELLVFEFAEALTGRLVLERIPERAFRIGFKTILTLLSLRLLYDAAGTLFN